MDKNTKFGYWVKVAPIAGFRLEGKFTRPEFVGKVETPENLDNLSIGQLIDLSSLSDTNESLYVVVQTILGLKTQGDRQGESLRCGPLRWLGIWRS